MHSPGDALPAARCPSSGALPQTPLPHRDPLPCGSTAAGLQVRQHTVPARRHNRPQHTLRRSCSWTGCATSSILVAAAGAWRVHLAVSSSSWWRCVGGATRFWCMPAEIGSLLSWVCGKKQCGSRSRAPRAADAVHARALAPRGGRGNVAGGSGVAQATDTGQVIGWCPSRHATGTEPNPNCCPLPYSPSLPRACARLHPMPRLAPVTSSVLLARRWPAILFPVLEGLQQSRHELGGPGNSGVL